MAIDLESYQARCSDAWGYMTDGADTIGDVVSFLSEAAEDAKVLIDEVGRQRWIPVAERLPADYSKAVLVAHIGGLLSLASHYGDAGHNLADVTGCTDPICPWRGWRVWQVAHPDYGGGVHGDIHPHQITHWMELPEPPR